MIGLASFLKRIKVASAPLRRGASGLPPAVGRILADVEAFCFPANCPFCREVLNPNATEWRWCEACAPLFKTDDCRFCPRCAAYLSRPLPSHEGCSQDATRESDLLQEGCCHCRGREFPFADSVSLGNYDSALREAVLRVKRSMDEPLLEALTLSLAERIEQQTWFKRLGAIAAVPSSPWRRLKRGYDVAELVSARLAERWRLPYLSGLIRMARKTKKQGTLTTRQRRLNMKGAMKRTAKAAVRLQAVEELLLVDDVLTSGATASEASRNLLSSPVRKVHLAVLARGIRGQNFPANPS
jgi:ComF family protein